MYRVLFLTGLSLLVLGVGSIIVAALMSIWFWLGSLAVLVGTGLIMAVSRAVDDPDCKLSVDDIFPDFKILD